MLLAILWDAFFSLLGLEEGPVEEDEDFDKERRDHMQMWQELQAL
jgi:hypothetical protein